MVDLTAKLTEYRGQTFDSQLEADWARSLDVWGVAWEHHPGRLHGYEPDFLLPGDPGMGVTDVVLEVKGWHNERFEKPLALARDHGAAVVIGRPGLVPSGSDAEQAGAVWFNVIPGGHEYFVWHSGISSHFVDTVWLEGRERRGMGGTLFASAGRVIESPVLEGLPMWKVTT